MRHIWLIVAFSLFFLFSNLSLSDEFDPKIDIYLIEYTRGYEGNEDVLTLIMTFNSPIKPSKAEELLRDEIKRAVQFKKPKEGILATALYQESKFQEFEKKIKMKDGSLHLVYIAETGDIQTYRIYEKSKARR